ncbi:MAG TPA: methyltransferase domain-containing protein, partial [Pyrinomonadaceae bacterium]|nr:methyltransferase domain-containing protein [Pyrinomonadaceae bacterium]
MSAPDSSLEKSSDSAASARSANTAFEYSGRELGAMASASNYHRWIIRMFAPYLGRHIVEVGAGLASFSELILKYHKCESLSLVEPSAKMYQQLVVNAPLLTKSKDGPRVDTYQSSFVAAAPLIRSKQTPDSIIYVNVLEHIADDELELTTIQQTLTVGGRVFLFVPALPRLYCAFDERVGHVRRYTKRSLEDKLKRAGFKIVLSSYFDVVGIAPWWIKYCLLKSVTMEPASVRFYDRFIVPA